MSAPEKFSLISDEKLISLYQDLLRCRMATRHAGAVNGKRSAMRAYEAATVGIAMDLGPEDAICAAQHGFLSLAPKPAADQVFLLATGHFPATNGNGSGLAYTHAALGAALANKTKKNGKVAVVFGNGKPSGTWAEALQTATTHSLPMIFVSQKDDESPRPRGRASRSYANETAKPGSAWFPTITVDSNDVVAMYRVANEAISRARQGRGPTLIECQPFRVKANHASTAKSNGNGRREQDAVTNMEEYLRGKGLFHAGLKRLDPEPSEAGD